MIAIPPSRKKSVIWPIVENLIQKRPRKTSSLKNEMSQGVPSSAQTPIKIHEKYNNKILLFA